MKKQTLLRIILGAPIGITISYFITIFISLTVTDGNYYPVVPALAESMGSELNAVLIQALLSALYGAVWGGLSIIWQLEHWSLLRMTATHFAIATLRTFPIAYFMQWTPHSLKGILSYFALFFAIYLAIWLSQYYTIKKRLKELNQKVQEQNNIKTP